MMSNVPAVPAPPIPVPPDPIQQVWELRNGIWQCGFRPVAVYNYNSTRENVTSPGKQPVGNDWTEHARENPPRAVARQPWFEALNTGILCDGLRAIDIDVDDAKLAHHIFNMAVERFGLTLVRIRNDSPRSLLVYRAAEGEPGYQKIGGGKTDNGKVEVLGKGKQFVCDGTHPDGGIYSVRSNNSSYKREDLPSVTEIQIETFLNEIAPLIVNANSVTSIDNGLSIFDATLYPPEIHYEQTVEGFYQACADYSQMGEGSGRNDALNKCSFMARLLIQSGKLTYDAAYRALYDSAMANGYLAKDGENAVVRTIHSGLGQKKQVATSEPVKLFAQPFAPIDFQKIPRRDWIYGKHYISQNVSATVSPGGVGKSSLSLVEAVAIATGRNLTGVHPERAARVWYINGEDPIEEIQRRLAAIMLHYGITNEELEGRLFINSGRDCDIVITKTERGSMTLYEPMLHALTEEIINNNIEVIILDPFVTVHTANENDNGQMNQVIKALRNTAHQTHSAIELVHHTRKLNGADTSMDDARGASSLQGGVRSMRTLSRMKKEDAEGLGIEDYFRHVRIDDAKNNMAPPDKAWWVRLASIVLPNGLYEGANGDEVGVVEGWQYPANKTEVYTKEQLEAIKQTLGNDWHRNHYKAEGWVGHRIAPILGLDSRNQHHAKRLSAFINEAIQRGAFQKDSRKVENSKSAPCVRVADWTKLSPPPESLVT